MERKTLIVGLHVLVAVGLIAVGIFRASAGQVGPGIFNVLMGAAVVGLGVYMGRLTGGGAS